MGDSTDVFRQSSETEVQGELGGDEATANISTQFVESLGLYTGAAEPSGQKSALVTDVETVLQSYRLSCVDLLELTDGYLTVDLRGGEIGVPQHLLNKT